MTDVILAVFPLNGRLLAAGDGLSGEAGLTSALWQVLGAIEDQPRSVSQISRVMGLARQSVQRSANIMERDGLVAYVPNPDHKTSPLVQMTVRGRAAYQKVMRLQAAWSDQLAKNFTADDLKTTARVLSAFLDVLEDNP